LCFPFAAAEAVIVTEQEPPDKKQVAAQTQPSNLQPGWMGCGLQLIATGFALGGMWTLGVLLIEMANVKS
jgi:hypothetical protein